MFKVDRGEDDKSEEEEEDDNDEVAEYGDAAEMIEDELVAAWGMKEDAANAQEVEEPRDVDGSEEEET